MGTYIPHTGDEVESMLAFLGLTSVEELFAVVPEALRLQRAGSSWRMASGSRMSWPEWRDSPSRTGPGQIAWSASPGAAPTTTRSPR